MTADEIRTRLARALPPIIMEQQEEESKRIMDYLDQPLGQVLVEYYDDDDCGTEQQNEEEEEEATRTRTRFVVTMASGAEAASFHDAVQPLALWFIETAEAVQLWQPEDNNETATATTTSSSSSRGTWKVVYLWAAQPPPPHTQPTTPPPSHDSKYSLAGYVTLFYFDSPFRRPRPGLVVRICQVLVLPPYQGSGHGRRLLQAVYNHVAHADPQVVEVNVEDPAPAFQVLRNAVDYQQFRHSSTPWFHHCDDDNDEYELSPTRAQEAASRAKITVRQVHLVYEMERYRQWQTANDDDHNDARRWRRMVQKRLHREHKEMLSSLPSKEELATERSRLYDQVVAQYRRILRLETTTTTST
jgi:histone acetyltransferase 1